MDPGSSRIAEDPANTIFAVVFFPDRIYHQEYLNATRSPRYRYNVQEVRGYHEVLCLKGQRVPRRRAVLQLPAHRISRLAPDRGGAHEEPAAARQLCAPGSG